VDPASILIFGKAGQVGWELRRTMAPLGHVVAVDYPEVDFTSPATLAEVVHRVRPSIILNASAYTAVDKAEAEADRCQRINGDAPGVLAELAKRQGALLVHYSTDYVFDGGKQQPYVEEDPANPLGVYGRTKWAGDQAVMAAAGEHLIFRLCWVYGTRGSNFLLTMMRLAKEREALRVVRDQVGCPTWSRLIAEATAFTAKEWMNGRDRERFGGVYHLASSNSTSWHGFASAIVEQVPPEIRKCRKVEPISTAEYPTPARRPAFSVLDCGKLQRAFGLSLPSWEESLGLAVEAI